MVSMASKDSRYARQHTSDIPNRPSATGSPPALKPSVDYEELARLLRKKIKKEIKKQFRRSLNQTLIITLISVLISVILAFGFYVLSTFKK